MRGLFVTGTGTGVGKTVLSAALIAAMRAAGEPVRAHKPVVTGLDEPTGDWPPDHELLALAAGMRPEDVAPLRYGPAVSPHLASALAGARIDRAVLTQNARRTARDGGAAGAGDVAPGEETTLIVEGVGGLLVPLAEDFTVCDLMRELGLPVLIAAPPVLGTINHTLLTLHTARGAGLDVRAVVLTPWPEHPSAMEHSNRETIARLGEVDVERLPNITAPELDLLAAAGDRLPWRRWIGP
jgi:dethiobiotin synthetase